MGAFGDALPRATLTLCWAVAMACVKVGEGYGANDVDGRGESRTCFCGETYENNNEQIGKLL